ncbi:hypothetical protein AMATHDRAFT_61585 [Amanita thiersii Skay4041]|uniref:Nop14-like protein n=1 Tax=Amanita thiersii Skay4041 TaxID=703135 RepID=A0A2A9NHP4_9AGAR|nr:hypothetical protein AMATHDRAFT_61585 [Amanita thiersii Skay4041]
MSNERKAMNLLNPFDIKTTRLKHNVGGRRIKGVSGKPTKSKQAGLEQRKKTLLREYEQRNRAGGILDRRFGEDNPTMSLEEKMLERFMRERQRTSRGAAFALEDGEELTHYGQSLSAMDDFDNAGLGLDDEDDLTDDGQDFLQVADFDDNGSRLRREEQEDEGSDASSTIVPKSKAEVMTEVIAKSKEHKLLRQMERERGDHIRLKLDQDFDSLRELLYSAPPIPANDVSSDNVHSTEKSTHQQNVISSSSVPNPEDQLLVASEDKDYDQRVRELAFDKRSKPKDRTKTKEELEVEAKEALDKAERKRLRRMEGLSESESESEGRGRLKRKRGGDDLDDDFDSGGDEFDGIGAGLTAVEEEDIAMEDNKPTFQAPSVAIIDHILHITAPPTPRIGRLSSFLPQLVALTKAHPTQTAEYIVKKLILMQKNLSHGLSQGQLNLQARTWPGLPELSLLRVIAVLWPTSDLTHVVVSPARILMGSYLGLCRVRSLTDIASGLFLCTLFLHYEVLSKRFVPEVINFLINTVLHLAPHGYKTSSSLPGTFASPDFGSNQYPDLTLNTKSGKGRIPTKPNLLALLSLEEPNEQAKADLLGLALDLLNRFADMYKGLEGFIELFEPILEIIQNIKTRRLAEEFQSRIHSLKNTLNRLLKFARHSRQPLQLQSHKPIPIPTYIPKFETSTSLFMKRKDPDHDRNEAAKLRSQFKQERKGAIRELRKDARFLAGVQLEKQKEKDRAYNERMKRVFGSLEGERAEEKAMMREKVKEKKRAGRR